MKSLSFKTMSMVFIFAMGILIVSPFTLDSPADSYDLYLVFNTVNCWDNSVSIDVLCYSYLHVVWWTDPMHDNGHSPSIVYLLSSADEDKFTDSCSIGCD